MRSPDGDSPAPRGGGESVGTAVPPDDSVYWTFYEQVADRQVQAWAPERPSRVLDLSGPSRRFAQQLAAAGHEVVHACSGTALVSGPVLLRDPSLPSPTLPGRLLPVLADARSLDWLADGSVDAVLAEARALSRCLATEVTVEDLRRVLRPGGTMLLVVDSLGLGLARLAEQGRWAELADVPKADVVLVPGEDGVITRCFEPEELVDLVQDAGLAVDWVRPRTVLTPGAVERALVHGARTALDDLVETELELAEKRAGESPGLHLVASARRAG